MPYGMYSKYQADGRLIKSWLHYEQRLNPPSCNQCQQSCWHEPNEDEKCLTGGFYENVYMREYYLCDGLPVCSERCIEQYFKNKPAPPGAQLSIF